MPTHNNNGFLELDFDTAQLYARILPRILFNKAFLLSVMIICVVYNVYINFSSAYYAKRRIEIKVSCTNRPRRTNRPLDSLKPCSHSKQFQTEFPKPVFGKRSVNNAPILTCNTITKCFHTAFIPFQAIHTQTVFKYHTTYERLEELRLHA
jgi:hypothetical protein